MLWLGLMGRKKLKQHDDALRDLKDDLERYARACQQLEVEWVDTLERINRQVGRVSAIKRRQLVNAEPPLEDVDPETAHLDPISRRIHADRKRGWFKNGQ